MGSPSPKPQRPNEDLGRTELIFSCLYNDRAKAFDLIKQGRDINATEDLYGWTALHMCCAYKRVEIAFLLIEKGCDMDIQDNEGKTPLMLAVSYNYEQRSEKHIKRTIEIYNKLIEKGCRIDLEDDKGKRAGDYFDECEWIHNEMRKKRQNALFCGWKDPNSPLFLLPRDLMKVIFEFSDLEIKKIL